MFDALEVSLQVLEQLVPIEARIRRANLELGKQLSRAGESMVLNLGEGRGRQGGDQRRHYEFAHGSAGEATVALRVAVIKGYVTRDDLAGVDPLLDRVRAMTYRLTHKR